MRFTYDDGGGNVQFTVDDDHVDFIPNRRIRKVDYRSVDQQRTEAKKGENFLLDIRFIVIDLTEKANIEAFFLALDKVEIDNFDEVQSGQTYSTFSGNMTVTRPSRDLNFRRIDPAKDIEYFSLNMQVVCDTKVDAVKP